MNLTKVQPIVDAVLYEGYILYPYRSSAAKNRQRWTFGGIYPRVYADATGAVEPCRMQTQCLVRGGEDLRVEMRVRFLQPCAREVRELHRPVATWLDEDQPGSQVVASLTVGGKQYHSWQEAVERDVAIAGSHPGELTSAVRHVDFAFEAESSTQALTDDGGRVAGLLRQSRKAINGRIELHAEAVAGNVYRLSIAIENHTDMDPATVATRDEASLYSFASTHTILSASHGEFISLMDAPAELSGAAAACDNRGVYPVLVGEAGDRDMLLSSPIILYDYPEVAPESPGDLFDAIEIDEILSLNILAMTDREKAEMRATDPRGAAILARTEAMGADDFMRLHGVLRQPRPAGETRHASGDNNPLEPDSRGAQLAWYGDGKTELRVGDRVRLHPRAGGDVMDLVLDGKSAVIESIERDFEDRIHVAVAIDEDPGREWGLARMPGHRFFFAPEEIESLGAATGRVDRVSAPGSAGAR